MKMARPLKEIDERQVELLAGVGCTVDEIAATLGCSKRTLETRFCALIENGRGKMRSSLRRKQVEVAMKGDKTMLIWLGKQLLGQKDRTENEHTGANGGPIEYRDVRDITDAELDAQIAALERGEVAAITPAGARSIPQ